MAIGIGLLIFNRVQKKKKASAEYAKWASAFPMNDDCQAMESLVKEAQKRYEVESNEYRNIKGLRPTKKAQAKRERDTLGDYINDLKGYVKDLQCGIQINNVPTPTPVPTPDPTPDPRPAPIYSPAAVATPEPIAPPPIKPRPKTLLQSLSDIVVPKKNTTTNTTVSKNPSANLQIDEDPEGATSPSALPAGNKKLIMYGAIAVAAVLGIYLFTKGSKK